MIKHLTFSARMSLLVVVALTGIIASSASSASAACRRVENFVTLEQAGNFTTSTCLILTTNALEGRWENLLFQHYIGDNLYCGKKEPGLRNSGAWTTNTCIIKSSSDTEFIRYVVPPLAALLPGSKFPATFSGTSGKGELVTVGKKTVKCKKDKSSGEFTGSEETTIKGTAKITFEECESSGFKCNSKGQKEGVIVSEGTTLLVFDSLTTLGVAVLLTLKPETEFECTSFVKVKVKGNVLLLIKPLEKETTEFELILKQKEGKPEDKTYWVHGEEEEKGIEEKAQLLTSINGGAFEESGDESAENKITTSKSMTVEG
jgi:hypothetical protein